jgi:hypothetical protein
MNRDLDFFYFLRFVTRIESTYFLPKDQRKCFADYYEELCKPKTDSFDNTYLELCNIRRKTILELE